MSINQVSERLDFLVFEQKHRLATLMQEFEWAQCPCAVEVVFQRIFVFETTGGVEE